MQGIPNFDKNSSQETRKMLFGGRALCPRLHRKRKIVWGSMPQRKPWVILSDILVVAVYLIVEHNSTLLYMNYYVDINILKSFNVFRCFATKPRLLKFHLMRLMNIHWNKCFARYITLQIFSYLKHGGPQIGPPRSYISSRVTMFDLHIT
jgi:hypothetical protein